MSDRIKGLTVYFKKPINEEYAKVLCDAIRCFEGVSKVDKAIVKPDYYFAVAEARAELRDKILELLLERER